MRNAYRGLTLRGRAFLAAGLTALVCAMAFTLPGLAAIGILLLALPLLTVAFIGSSRQQLTLTRTLSSPAVPVGQPAEVSLTVRKNGPAPRGTLLLEDKVAFALGARPRFLVDDLERHHTQTFRYQVRSDVRGRFEIGPLGMKVCDGLGLVEMTRSFSGSTGLIVTPRGVPLPGIPLRAEMSGSGEARPRSFAVGSAEDVTVRDYRRGDDLRRVHWRSTARTGQLMVRREERPWQAKATVLLDNRADSHQGLGAASSLEIAVTTAASVASHLIRAGFATRLATATGVAPGTGFNKPGSTDTPILEALALVPQERTGHLDLSWLGDYDSGGLTVAVLGQITSADLPGLRRLASHTGTCLGLVVETGGQPGEDAVKMLASIGWRAASLGRADQIPTAWRRVGVPFRARSAG